PRTWAPSSTPSAAWAVRRRRRSSSRWRAAAPTRRSAAPPRAPTRIWFGASRKKRPASPTAGELLEKIRSAARALRLQVRPATDAAKAARGRRPLLSAGGRQLLDLRAARRREGGDDQDRRPGRT